MREGQTNRKIKIGNCILLIFSFLGLIVCIAVLFPQVRQMIMNLFEQIYHRKASSREIWLKVLLSYAMGGICFILCFDYCTLTDPGRKIIQKVKQELSDCLSEIDFRSFIKPILLMFGVYLLGIFTIIRANYSYLDDLGRSISGYRKWHNESRYVSEFSSILVHGDTHLTDISPLPQLSAIFILSLSSVLLVYIIGNKKMTVVRLLASVPLGLSPYFLECLSFNFDAPYMALSILASIVPFLFIARRKAFLFSTIVSLLIMCMTYQAASGIYLLVVVILCFQDWNSRKKSNKEILSFLGIAAFAFCVAMLLFKFFFMKSFDEHESGYVSNKMHSFPQIIIGVLNNIKNYTATLNHDLGIIWKICIIFVLLFFILQSMYRSAQKKINSFFVSTFIIGFSFIFSYGIYSLLKIPSFRPRALFGFGFFLACFCIYVAKNNNKPAVVSVIALNWCFFIFAFSYGNALSDQKRFVEFRIGLLLHDLSDLYPNMNDDDLSIQIKNSIDYVPSIKNIAKHYPIVESLVPKLLGEDFWDYFYLIHFNIIQYKMINNPVISSFDFCSLNLPVVLDSYYHTIRSDGSRVLIILKH